MTVESAPEEDREALLEPATEPDATPEGEVAADTGGGDAQAAGLPRPPIVRGDLPTVPEPVPVPPSTPLRSPDSVAQAVVGRGTPPAPEEPGSPEEEASGGEVSAASPETETEDEAAPPEPGETSAPESEAREESETTATEARPEGGGRAGFQQEAEAEEGDGALPVEVADQALQPLEAPPLDWQPLASDWDAPDSIPERDLLPAAEQAPATQASQTAADSQGEKQTGETGAAAAAEPGQDARQKRRAEAEAARQAQRAYQDLARDARREQEGFVDRANRLSHYMAQAYGLASGEITQAHDRDQGEVEQAAGQATGEVENAASLARMSLDQSSRQTALAISAAGRSAYGLIAAGETGAAARIGQVVTSLVAGHVSAYNGAVRQAETASRESIAALNTFRDQRATTYPTGRGAYLERAKNEKRQLRIPRWVEPETTQLQERFDRKKEAWEGSRDSTSCSLGCGYREALDAENTRMAQQGRQSVAGALGRARRTLRQQTRDGRRAINDMLRAYLRQISTQARATRSRLNSTARAMLAGARQEAQGAVGGVQGAARGALPTYASGARGLQQSLRNTVARGAQALNQTAQRAPAGVLANIRRAGAQLDKRLDGNRQRLETSMQGRRDQHVLQSTEQTAQLTEALGQIGTQAAAGLDDSVNGFTRAFGSLAETVTGAAANWAQPLERRMAGFIDQKRQEAASALASLRSGAAPESGGGEGGGEGGGGGSCGGCASATGGGGGGGGGTGGGAASAPGLDQQVRDEVAHYTQRRPPATYFATRLEEAGGQAQSALETRANNVVGAFGGGFAGSVDEAGVVGALRGMTFNQGRALDTQVYPGRHAGRHLDVDLRDKLGADSTDYQAASAYLWGDNVTGARLELRDSLGFFNDDEARIEAVMRSLSPDQLAALGRSHPGVMDDVRDSLGGTDLQVFNALAEGNYARADAFRMRDAVDEARRDGNADAVHAAIERYTGAPAEGDWRAAQEMGADERRRAAVAELGLIVSGADLARETGAGELSDERRAALETAAADYVTRDIEVYVGGGPEGEPQTVTLSITGANRDLAVALLRNGEDSVEARAARLGVEMQRRGDPPNSIKIDRATFDPRFSANLAHATPAERDAHRRAAEERARVVMLAAERYAGGEATPEDYQPATDPDDPNAAMSETRVTAARDRLIHGLEERFGSDTVGAELAAGLLTDARPTPETAALAMEHAQQGWGTNEELLFRFTERMNRDEIAAMRAAYRFNTGRSLDADLGVYGEGSFGEVSGDDRLRMERALLGQPRNDRERLEVAAFAIEQQRRESSDFGSWLAEGTLAEEAMSSTEAELREIAGGPIRISRRGEIAGLGGNPNFDANGRYVGEAVDHDRFVATTGAAQQIAETYARRIDAFADIATTGIAILGAIAAAVITVVTGGAAAPLIAAAIVTGLASMSANYAIKGGRYGWEQAAVDLGMTAVQAITAGVGAQLGAAAQVASKGAQAATQASRTIATLSRIFTGNPVMDQMIIGAITGSIGGLGGAVFDERTWEHGADDAVGALFAGLIRGALSGAATAAVTSSIENLGRSGRIISDRLQALSAQGGVLRGGGAMLARGGARALISGTGAMAGRGAELMVDSATGRFRGDIGEAFEQMGHAGLHAMAQGFGEGAGEAVGQGFHNRRLAAAGEAINAERLSRGMDPLEGHGLDPHSPLGAAAQDLMLMGIAGRHGGDGLGRALNLDHVVIHGGMAPTVATPHPHPTEVEAMRVDLMRHLPAEQRADFADVPIRVLSEAEYRALTRSESGPVVTLIEHGQPVVVIREGTPIARLADEGTHLAQTRDAHTRERVARLDESTLARWDSLDLDSQLSLYQDKIHLEIDAHQRVGRSLEAELASARSGGADEATLARLGMELERNQVTLDNLHARAEEVAGIGPGRRAAMAAGEEARPQYLDQPARLFSKDSPRPGTAGAEAETGPARRREAGEAEGEEATPPRRPPPTPSEADAGTPAPRPGYEGQPELRGPRQTGVEADSEAGLRQRHEDWVEGARRGYLDAGSMPRAGEGEVPRPGRPPWHDSIEDAYRAYDALVREHGGQREAGIVRNALTGEYMVVLGSPVDLRIPLEAMRQETVLHFHPDYGPSLYRGPSGTDLGNTAAIARATGRPVTEFIEYHVPGVGRGRTAFTLTPVPDPTVPGGVRMRIDIEFVNPATGQYTHQRFNNRSEWSDYYHGRATALDPDSAIYRHIMGSLGASEAQIDALAAGHRPEGAPVPPRPEGLPPPRRGRSDQAVVDVDGGEPAGTRPSTAPEAAVEPQAPPAGPRAAEVPAEAGTVPPRRETETVAPDPVSAARDEAAATRDPATQADTGKLPDAAELIALRAEEQSLQTRHAELADTQGRMAQVLEENLTRLARDREDLEPLAARRGERADEHEALRQRRRTLQEEQERHRLPTDEDITPEERQAFARLSPEEKQRIRAERQRIDGELREVGQRMSDLGAELRDLNQRISTLNRRMKEAQDQVDSLAAPVKRMAGELEAMRARLAEIEARRGAVIGEWAGHFDRIGERPPCFLAGTPVHTPAGSRPIESLAAGDLVYAWDTTTGRRTTRRVLRPETGRTERVVTLSVSGEVIRATPRHRFWSPERSEWLELQAFAPGMVLLDLHGGPRIIESLAEGPASAPTYNLLVDGEHDYFVGHAGVLAHNGKDPDELSDSIFRDEIITPPDPFEVRFYVIVHADNPDVIIYVGSTEQTLADRLRGHVRDRVYLRGDKAGQAWLDEVGGRVRIARGDDPTQVRAGKFIMREIASRACHSRFERFVWELYYIESIRAHSGDTMQNDFDTPPVGRKKFDEFRDYYLTQLCAAA